MKSISTLIATTKTRLQMAKEQEEKSTKTIKSLRKKLKACLVIQGIVQATSLKIQTELFQYISNIVNVCLQAVFDEPYEFKIVSEGKRQGTEARLIFVKDGEEYDPLDEASGGAKNVASLGLSVAMLLLARPSLVKCLFLDESFSNLDKKSPDRVIALLERLSKEFDLQIVHITHNSSLVSGKEVRL